MPRQAAQHVAAAYTLSLHVLTAQTPSILNSSEYGMKTAGAQGYVNISGLPLSMIHIHTQRHSCIQNGIHF